MTVKVKSIELQRLISLSPAEVRLSGSEKQGRTEIFGVEYDSRKVFPGALFVAVKGFESDGHGYVRRAVEAGAAAVVVSEDRAAEFEDLSTSGTAVIVSSDTRRTLSALSAAFFGFPSRGMRIVGVTGTNGKTSITYMIESALKQDGASPGVIGTVNYRWAGKTLDAPNTTPESRDLQELLYSMSLDGVDTVVMEVSSHALELGRAVDIEFDCAIFTNLTGDHLDFHRDMESYFNAKLKLFDHLDKSSKPRKAAVVNVDDEYGKRIYADRDKYQYPVYSFGVENPADYMPEKSSILNRITGLAYMLKSPEKAGISLKIAGRFHVYNSLAALSALHSLGVGFSSISEGLASLEAVPGRFDVRTSKSGFSVVVDYAHTGDALEKLLQSVRELDHNRLITVFGCGGDRDKTKRPVMGRIASEYSDIAIVTSDNPRTEDPALIIKDIIPGIKNENYEVIEDRTDAIKYAVNLAVEGDIIVIAGKGHETYQIIGKTKTHYDDHEVAGTFISRRESL